jgi:sugar phosphate isomerase/epimerase
MGDPVFKPGKYLGEMPVGFLDVPLAPWPLDKVVDFGVQNGFKSMEMGTWPKETSRAGADAFVCNHVDPEGNFVDFTQAKADDLNARIKGRGIENLKFGYYDNMLDANEQTRSAYHSHFKNVVLGAQKMGVPTVGFFVGRMQGTTEDQSLKLYPKLIAPLVQFATDHGVKAEVEHCPMENWVADPETGITYRIGNIARSPRNLRYMLEVTPDLGLCVDPSHLEWQGIKPATDFVREFLSAVQDGHAKDWRQLNSGLFVPVNYEKGGFDDSWPNRDWGAGVYVNAIPGQGNTNFGEWIGAMREGGRPLPINIELEAPEYQVRVNPDRSAFGLLVAKENLAPYCKDQTPFAVGKMAVPQGL